LARAVGLELALPAVKVIGHAVMQRAPLRSPWASSASGGGGKVVNDVAGQKRRTRTPLAPPPPKASSAARKRPLAVIGKSTTSVSGSRRDASSAPAHRKPLSGFAATASAARVKRQALAAAAAPTPVRRISPASAPRGAGPPVIPSTSKSAPSIRKPPAEPVVSSSVASSSSYAAAARKNGPLPAYKRDSGGSITASRPALPALEAPSPPPSGKEGSGGVLSVALISAAKDRHKVNAASEQDIKRFIQTYGLSRDVELAIRMLKPDMVYEFLSGEEALRNKFAEVSDREQLILDLVFQLDPEAESLLFAARRCADLSKPTRPSLPPKAPSSISAKPDIKTGLGGGAEKPVPPAPWVASSMGGGQRPPRSCGESEGRGDRAPIGGSTAPPLPRKQLGARSQTSNSDRFPRRRASREPPPPPARAERRRLSCGGGGGGAAEEAAPRSQSGEYTAESRHASGGYARYPPRTTTERKRSEGRGTNGSASRHHATAGAETIRGSLSHHAAIGRRIDSKSGLGERSGSARYGRDVDVPRTRADRSRSPPRPWQVEANGTAVKRRDSLGSSANDTGSQRSRRFSDAGGGRLRRPVR